MQHKCPNLCGRITSFRKGELNLLADVSDFPTVAILWATDGGIEHAVTVVGNWVFDSNLDRALPLSKGALDWCCVSEYKGVYWAMRFKP